MLEANVAVSCNIEFISRGSKFIIVILLPLVLLLIRDDGAKAPAMENIAVATPTRLDPLAAVAKARYHLVLLVRLILTLDASRYTGREKFCRISLTTTLTLTLT